MFHEFLNSLKRSDNASLIEAVHKGYNTCFEAIDVYHGSGKEFSSFLMDKVGTGEGHQMFGYGLYFTESEEAANYYANEGDGVVYRVTIPTDYTVYADWEGSADNYAHQILEYAKEQEWKESDIDDLMDTFGFSEGYGGQPDTFNSLYGLLAGILGGQKEASQFLLKAGIAGIKYKSGSLSGVEDSDFYNYVLFDQNAAKIKEKL